MFLCMNYIELMYNSPFTHGVHLHLVTHIVVNMNIIYTLCFNVQSVIHIYYRQYSSAVLIC